MHTFVLILLWVFGFSAPIFIILEFIKHRLWGVIVKNTQASTPLCSCSVYSKITCIKKIQMLSVMIWLIWSVFVVEGLLTNGLKLQA